MKSISPTLLVVALLANVAATRLGSLFLPDRLYFSFSSFLFDTRDLNKPLAIAAKLMVPLATSFLLAAGLLALQRMRRESVGTDGWPDQVVADQAVVTLSFAAFGTALLMAWPYILLWDLLIAPELTLERTTFLVAYLAYFFATAFFAMAGANTALALATPKPRRAPLTLSGILESRFSKPVVDLISGAVSAFLATAVAAQGG